MSIVVQAIYEGGIFRPQSPVPELGEGTAVLLKVDVAAKSAHEQAKRSLSGRELRELIRSKNPGSENNVPQELWEELEKSLEIALSNVRDPEVMRQGAEDMDRLRERIYKREGLLDIVMPLLRETRNSQ